MMEDAKTLTPEFLDASVRKTMQLVSDVYDGSGALDRNQRMTKTMIEAQKAAASTEQRNALVEIDDLRESIRRARLRNVRYGVVVKFLAAIGILAGLYCFLLTAFPKYTVQHESIDKLLLVSVFLIVCVLFGWYASKYIKNLA